MPALDEDVAWTERLDLAGGLFHFVINAVTFGIAAALVPGVALDGFVAALIGALLVSAVGLLMSVLVGERS